MTEELSLGVQIVWLFTLGIPVATVAWTVTHEEVFREPREFCEERCRNSKHWYTRKFFYLFTCEYCFSHYVSIGALVLTGFHLLLDDWRGYLIAWFALVWVANQYMSIHARLKVGISNERAELKVLEQHIEEEEKGVRRVGNGHDG